MSFSETAFLLRGPKRTEETNLLSKDETNDFRLALAPALTPTVYA